jgi:hypothetical protein
MILSIFKVSVVPEMPGHPGSNCCGASFFGRLIAIHAG